MQDDRKNVRTCPHRKFRTQFLCGQVPKQDVHQAVRHDLINASLDIRKSIGVIYGIKFFYGKRGEL